MFSLWADHISLTNQQGSITQTISRFSFTDFDDDWDESHNLQKSASLGKEHDALPDNILIEKTLGEEYQKIISEYEERPIDYMYLLEGKIITDSEQEQQQKQGSKWRRGGEQTRGRWGKKHVGGGGEGRQQGDGNMFWLKRCNCKEPVSPFIRNCTAQQVSRMGNRRVPFHVARLGKAHSLLRTVPPPTKDEALEALHALPSCELYNSWLEQKQILLADSLNNMTLRDLRKIHYTCEPGDVTIPIMWNAIGRTNAEARRSRAFEVRIQSDDQRQDSEVSTCSRTS